MNAPHRTPTVPSPFQIAWSHYLAQLYDLDVDVPLTDREEYSEVIR